MITVSILLDSVEKILDTKYGIMILQPAYRSYHLELGEVSSYPPGYKENAGIFCHNNPWVSIAETVIDDKNRAFETYKKICPAGILSPSSLSTSSAIFTWPRPPSIIIRSGYLENP